MLKITKKTEYALIALSHLENQEKDSLISAKEIAAQYPQIFLSLEEPRWPGSQFQTIQLNFPSVAHLKYKRQS